MPHHTAPSTSTHHPPAAVLARGATLALAALLYLFAGQPAPACGGEAAAASQPAESQPAESQPAASQPAQSQPSASQPAESQPATPPDTADGWLELIEKETAGIKTLQAKVRYDRVQELLGDEQRRFGTLVFVAGPPARFAVHFHLLLADDLPHELDKWYIFDGQWFVERDDQSKKAEKIQIAPTNAAPDQANPLALGDGPFALPIGAKKERILKRFTVKLIAPVEDDPPDTVHLRLIARPDRDIDYDRIDLWYHRKLFVPMRAATRQAGSADKHIFNLLSNIRINEEVEDDQIDTTIPDNGRGWHVEITPWEEPAPPPAKE